MVHERTIGKILKKEGLVRKYRVRKIKYKYIRALRQPGELVEIDVKYVPGRIKNKRYYQYTAVDTASRRRHLAVYDEQTNFHSVLFLREVMEKFEHKIQAVKTDNGSLFTNYYTSMTKRSDMTVKTIHALDIFCQQNNIIHYLIDPGKPAQNGTVERSHREDQEKFYDKHKFKSIRHLRKELGTWNTYYNNLEHCGLDGKTPNEFLSNYKLNRQMSVPKTSRCTGSRLAFRTCCGVIKITLFSIFLFSNRSGLNVICGVTAHNSLRFPCFLIAENFFAFRFVLPAHKSSARFFIWVAERDLARIPSDNRVVPSIFLRIAGASLSLFA